jgi:hypothetical protein
VLLLRTVVALSLIIDGLYPSNERCEMSDVVREFAYWLVLFIGTMGLLVLALLMFEFATNRLLRAFKVLDHACMFVYYRKEFMRMLRQREEERLKVECRDE